MIANPASIEKDRMNSEDSDLQTHVIKRNGIIWDTVACAVSGFGSGCVCVCGGGGGGRQGFRTYPPLKKHNIGFLSNTGPENKACDQQIRRLAFVQSDQRLLFAL